jgi:mono/diheme cytochrome c family protein
MVCASASACGAEQQTFRYGRDINPRRIMNRFNSSRMFRVGAGLAVVAAIAYAVASVALARDAEPRPKKKLTGEQLYAINCNRCHAERYATERTDAQWKTVMLHMRTRAQIPAEDAKAILKYLQENN